jgi:hypothetical protein
MENYWQDPEWKKSFLQQLNERFYFCKNGEILECMDIEALNMEKNPKVVRMDFPGEIIDLWHEVTYLRVILGYVLGQIPGSDEIYKDLMTKSRSEAQEVVRKKFPTANIQYESEQPDAKE